jgi:hypothetical protein
MNLRSLAAASVLAAFAATVFADDTAGAQSATQAKPEADPNRKVCKQERPMGSLIPTRTCKTAAQWENERENSRKMVQDMQQRTGSTSSR